jgi:hypothetical protein
MIRLIASNIIRFIFLVVLQVVILNNIGLFNMVNPYLYILFILLLPLDIPTYLLLILAFALGLTIDMFSDTGGIHAAATVFMAFCRPLILTLITPRGGYEHEPVPNLKNMGFQWFLMYSVIMVLLHHLVLFNLEMFRLSEFFITFLRVIFSSIFTLILMIISQYIFSSSKQR